MRAWIAILGGDGALHAQWRHHTLAQFQGLAVQRFACTEGPVVGAAEGVTSLLMQIDYQACAVPVPRDGRVDAAARRTRDGTAWTRLSRPLSYVGWWREAEGALRSSFRDDAITESAFFASLLGEFNLCGLSADAMTLRADHYATQPCYYLPLGGGWLAVSDIRLAYGLVPAHFRVKDTALTRLLSADSLAAENDGSNGETCFDAVWKVRPGETVVLRQGNPACRRKAVDAMAPMAEQDTHRLSGARDATHAFFHCFNACVADRIAAGAGGVLLSGGLDSSSVYAASHLVPASRKMHGVCLSFSDPDLALSQDERIVSEMVQTLGGSYDIFHADADLRIPLPNDTGMHLDGPDLCANVLSKAAVARLFARQGTDFVMTGEGGDAILGEVYYAWLGDAVLRADGLAGLDRYLTQGRGMRRGFPAYLLECCAAFSSRWTGWRAARSFARSVTMPSPPYLLSHGPNGGADRRARFFRSRMTGLRERSSSGDASSRPVQCGAHRLLDAMLFPRAAYFDAIGTHLFHSHPFLDPRMLALARRIPAHCHYDLDRLRPHHGYACGKQLARNAYRHVLPDSAANKREKTSYALMARKLFTNSVHGAREMMRDGLLLADRGLVDAAIFRRHFNAYAIVCADPNADLGMGFHYLRAVLDTEVWLRQLTSDQARQSCAGLLSSGGVFSLSSVVGMHQVTP